MAVASRARSPAASPGPGPSESAATPRRPHAAVSELTAIALQSGGLDDLMARMAGSVARWLAVDCCHVLELQPDGTALVLRAGTGWDEALFGRERVRASVESYPGAILAAGEPVASQDLRAERRFKVPPLFRNRGLRSAAGVAIPGPDRPFGILGVGVTRRHVFTAEELQTLEFAAGLLGTAIRGKRAETSLRDKEERFRSLIENASDLITVIDREGTFLYQSPSVERILGYTPEELIGRNIMKFLHSDDAPRILEVFRKALEHPGSAVSAEYRFRLKDGSWRCLEGVGKALADTAGAVVGVINSRDISERKEAEKRAQRQLYRLAGLRAIDMAISSSLDLRLTLSVLLDQVTSQLGVDAAAVLLLNPHSLTLECGAARGFRTAARQHVRLRLGEGHAGHAALERRIVRVRDLGDAARLAADLPPADEGFVAYFALPLAAKGQAKGVLEIFHRSPLDPDAEWLDYAQTLAGQAAIAIDSATVYDELQRSHVELTLAYDTTLEGWSRALDLRDHATEGHTRRVTEMTLRLARAMGLTDAELVHVRRGAILHDIGKMAIPDAVLLKPGPLSEDEWKIMRRHPVYAYELLSPIPYLRPALEIPYCHHERWDGKGYPRGLQGEQIPLAARIFAVVDVWDALRSDRPYRRAWPEDRVMDYIRQAGGTHLDPRVLEVFLELKD